MYDREIALANVSTDAAMMATATGLISAMIVVTGLFKRQWFISALGASSVAMSMLLLRRYRSAQQS